MAILITIWGLRLTINAILRGYYTWTHEDYRWPIAKKKYGIVLYKLLNITFVAPF